MSLTEPTAFLEATYYVFVALCLVYFLRVFRDPKSFLTYPVLTAAIWLAYIAPQAFGILYNPIHLSSHMYYHGYPQTMIMCTLCVLMGAGGWHWRMRRLVYRPVPADAAVAEAPPPLAAMDPGKLMVAGAVLTGLGLLAFSFLARMTGGIAGFYSVGGNYALDWLGGEVIAVFFMQTFLNLGVIVSMFSLFLRPSLITGLVVCIALAPSLADILILNRRSDVIYVAISILAPAYFVKGWAPSRKAVVVGVVLGLFVVFTFPIIRGAFLIGAEREAVNLTQAFQSSVFDKVLGGEQHKEFNNSVGLIASADRLSEFAYGTITWNSWVKTTIPRTFFGNEIKEFLSFSDASLQDLGSRAYGWTPKWFQSRSAAALMFVEFWYFGCLIFWVLGYAFASLYSSALLGNLKIQMTYAAIALFLPHWIAVGFYKAPRNIILTLIILKAVEVFAKRRRRRMVQPVSPYAPPAPAP